MTRTCSDAEPCPRASAQASSEVESDSIPAPWHHDAVGGLWEELGRLQFDFLVAHGLRPHHRLLDVGCGSLRGGVHFILYLERGHYYGVDKNPDMLAAGQEYELRPRGLTTKDPVLEPMEDFGFDRLGAQFDFAIAQSVFSHLPLNDITRCLMAMERVLVPGGAFYATFFENPGGKRHLDPIVHPVIFDETLTTYFDRDPFHYDLATFAWICEGTALAVERIGPWDHPRAQHMLCFRKSAELSVTPKAQKKPKKDWKGKRKKQG